MKNWFLATAVLLSLMLPSCSSQTPQNDASHVNWLPPLGFKDSDLIGTWKSEWSEGPSAQILVFRNDKTFSQTYILNSSGQEFDTQGTWFIVNASEGCTYIHANGMRYYYGLDSLAQNGNRNPDGTPFLFWDGCQKKRVEMPDFVLLGIGHDSGNNSRIFLYQMSLDPDTGDPVLRKVGPASP
jgi:hypothetical protein